MEHAPDDRRPGGVEDAVRRWFALFGVKPHPSDTFRLSSASFLIAVIGKRSRRPTPTSTLSCTATQPTGILGSGPGPGSRKGRATISTSPSSRPHGSTRYVERRFGPISQRAIRRGPLDSVPQPVRTIEAFMERHSASTLPLVRVVTAESILARLERLSARVRPTQH